jgi:lipopolysaccharide export system permease protein
MSSIGRYVFRTTIGAFFVIVTSLTALIWITQALRDIDIMTGQGQTVLVFVGITGLIIPLLILIIAPIAIVISTSYVLNKLGNDSEIIVMNAAGMSPWRLLTPFLAAAGVVAILVGFLSTYGAPEGLRSLRRWLIEVRTDLVTNIVQPGRFINVEAKVTFHMRERSRDGQLLGVVIDDQRNPKEHVTIIAEQGDLIKNEQGTFLIMTTGTVQRHEVGERDPTLVVFDRYAFDLSKFGGAPAISYSVRERYLWQLISPEDDDELARQQPAQFRAEMHDRLVAPLYPFAFVLLAYAYLGAPRTTRTSRGLSLLGAISAVAALRIFGFACNVIGVYAPVFLALQYVAIFGAIAFSLWTIGRGVILEPPAFLTNAVNTLIERIMLRFGKAKTQ